MDGRIGQWILPTELKDSREEMESQGVQAFRSFGRGVVGWGWDQQAIRLSPNRATHRRTEVAFTGRLAERAKSGCSEGGKELADLDAGPFPGGLDGAGWVSESPSGSLSQPSSGGRATSPCEEDSPIFVANNRDT